MKSRRATAHEKALYWNKRITDALARGAAKVEQDEKGPLVRWGERVFRLSETPVEVKEAA